jgi:hypothetical protein
MKVNVTCGIQVTSFRMVDISSCSSNQDSDSSQAYIIICHKDSMPIVKGANISWILGK